MMSSLKAAIAVALSLLVACVVQAAAPIEIGSRLEPFVDGHLIAELSGGFRLVASKVLVLTGAELFHRSPVRRGRTRARGKPIGSLMQLDPGDLVVHLSHGIGLYRGLTTIEKNGPSWSGISAESVARMRAQNKFQTGLDIARYTAKIMREDMAAYDKDPANYTQSLGCWHGFIGQQKMISIKKHFDIRGIALDESYLIHRKGRTRTSNNVLDARLVQ